jgi:hypothetical protein
MFFRKMETIMGSRAFAILFLGCSIVAHAETEIQVTPDDLLDAYKANEVGADQAYRGKRLLVVGSVKKVSKNFLGQIMVDLSTDERFSWVTARLEKETEKQTAQLKPADRIKLHCVGEGMTLGFPFVGKCNF